jgi:hypothetical protein
MENSGYAYWGTGGPNSTPINCKASQEENHSRGQRCSQEQYRAVCTNVSFFLIINLKINIMELKKEQAKQIYEHVPGGFKKLLETEFGPETFRKIDFRDLNSFEDLCKAKGTTAAEFEAKLKDLPVSDQAKRFMRMEVISEGINQGWEPDHLDTTQRKWTPVFKVSSVGLDFSTSRYYYDNAHANVGFPFAFESEEKSNHAGIIFSKFWIEFITRKTL